jgi:Outer membrane protein/protective antigen OMA87
MIAAPADLNTVVALDDLAKSKEFFDRSVMRSDLQKLTEHYSNFGYAFAEADVKMARNEEDSSLDITYVMSKGTMVSINRVLIEGNSKTRITSSGGKCDWPTAISTTARSCEGPTQGSISSTSLKPWKSPLNLPAAPMRSTFGSRSRRSPRANSRQA